MVVPPPGRSKILAELHEAHPGISRMKALARSYVWWPGLDTDIERQVKAVTSVNSTSQPPQLHPYTRGNGRAVHGVDCILIMQVLTMVKCF